MTSTPSVAVIVLAGGRATRFGSDKLAATLGDRTVLDWLLDSLPQAWDIVAVGPPRATHRLVRWTRESPPGGGPLAGIAAGLAELGDFSDSSGPQDCASEIVAVVAGDMPWAAPGLSACVRRLALAPAPLGAVIAQDESGHPNPLLAAYRRSALTQALPADPHGRAARTLLSLTHDLLSVTADTGADIDTPQDLPGRPPVSWET